MAEGAQLLPFRAIATPRPDERIYRFLQVTAMLTERFLDCVLSPGGSHDCQMELAMTMTGNLLLLREHCPDHRCTDSCDQGAGGAGLLARMFSLWKYGRAAQLTERI